MDRHAIQISLTGMLGLVACVAVNIWLFRVSALLGIIGLNVSKHLIIAYLCKVIGLDKRRGAPGAPAPQARPPGLPAR